MKIELTKTEKLVQKTLALKPFYQRDSGAGLVVILDAHCTSDEHREKVCMAALGMKFVRNGKPEDCCPGPAELLDLIRDNKSGPREADPGCPMCEGSGFEQLSTGSKRCRCGGVPASSEAMFSYHRRMAKVHPERYGPASAIPEVKSL